MLVNAHAPGAVKTNLLAHILGPGGDLERRFGPHVPKAIAWLLARVVWHPRDASLTQVYAALLSWHRQFRHTKSDNLNCTHIHCRGV